MDLVVWNPMLSVKVEKMDEQHKKIIELINKVFHVMEEESDIHIIKCVLEELIKYTKTHFKSEEGLLSKYKYPGLAEHKKVHSDLIDEINEFDMRLDIEGSGIKKDLFIFLKSWLTSHIMGIDKKYSEYLNKNNIK